MNIIRPVYAVVDFSQETENPIAKFKTISSFVNLIIPLMMIVGGFITLFMFIYGAFSFITSEGNADKIKKSQSIFKYATLGLFFMVVSYILTKVIGYVLNVKIMPL